VFANFAHLFFAVFSRHSPESSLIGKKTSSMNRSNVSSPILRNGL
jgi:hypothetical protein